MGKSVCHLEAAAHIITTVMKENTECLLLSWIQVVQDPLPTDHTQLRWVFPHQYDLPRACSEACLPDDAKFCQVDDQR